MPVALFKRRSVWWPTWVGWLLLVGLILAPALAWAVWGERFLSHTERVPADVLVVEGWIGGEGARAAADEFTHGGYKIIVTTGGLTGAPWADRRWSYAAIASESLRRAGVPPEAIIDAPADDSDKLRTFNSAVAVARELQIREIQPKGLNVFTRTVHARRSRTVFSKVLGRDVPVGAVAWQPPGFNEHRWWEQTYRVDDLLQETAAYAFELVFGSARLGSAGAVAVPSSRNTH